MRIGLEQVKHHSTGSKEALHFLDVVLIRCAVLLLA
jgi:hypothetical protein